MNILWIVNIILPEVRSVLFKESKNALVSGSWLEGYANSIRGEKDKILAIATISKEVKTFSKIQYDGVSYFVIPFCGNYTNNDESYASSWRKIYNEFKPDIVHIHGTEFFYGLTFLNTFPNIQSVVSIQGIISACSDFYSYGLTFKDILFHPTIRDIIRGGIWKEKKEFKKRGFIEKKILKRVKNVIGRTEWDECMSISINPNLRYFKCNEPLRDVFYNSGKWKFEKCHPHTIFLSQASYPLKGLHQLIRALPIVLAKYPDTRVRIGGINIIDKPWFKMSGYGSIIVSLIKRYKLEGILNFMGPLSKEEVRDELLTTNVFVCPSSVENSPNSVGEAQILGVPCVASFVGGVPSFFPDKLSQYLYRYEDYEMLAQLIINIFDMAGSFDNGYEIKVAEERHSKKTIMTTLNNIYCELGRTL